VKTRLARGYGVDSAVDNVLGRSCRDTPNLQLRRERDMRPYDRPGKRLDRRCVVAGSDGRGRSLDRVVVVVAGDVLFPRDWAIWVIWACPNRKRSVPCSHVTPLPDSA